ncbi:MAG: hypothetical protein EOP84_20225 [Verrucomicrobiaceae bacterium]|nr:MAG: hypothetical protein EOP84_20225 [Verrucomicrobiaceae bacterium]
MHRNRSEESITVNWQQLELRLTLEGYVPRFEHLLIDLARETPEGLRGNAEVRLALGLLKASAERRLMEWLEWGVALMRLVHSPEMLQVFFRYMASVESGLNLKTVAEKVRYHRLPQAECAIMTIAEELKAEGWKEGRREGRKEGERRGVLIGAVQTLERLLGKAETPDESFSEQSLEDLQAQVEALNEEVRVRLSR